MDMKKLLIFCIITAVIIILLVAITSPNKNDNINNNKNAKTTITTTLSKEAIKNIQDNLDSDSLVLKMSTHTMSTIKSRYQLCKNANNASGARDAYNDMCNSFDDILNEMKGMIEYCNSNSTYFPTETRNSINELKQIYDYYFGQSQKLSKSSESTYIRMIEDLCDSISEWKYVNAN